MVLAGDIAVFLTFIFSAAFCIVYGFAAKWWRSEFGLHIWSFTLMYAVLFGWFSYAVLTRDYPPPQEQWMGRFIFIAMQAAFMGWRLSLLIRMQILRKPDPPTEEQVRERLGIDQEPDPVSDD